MRVGTHARKSGSNTSFWKRLSQHRGRVRSGGGNHRGSIFRLIVGTALIAKHGLECATWDDRTSTADIRAGEAELEREVSKAIGAMQFLWLPIDDEPGDASARGYIEPNAIALLSNFEKEPVDPPSAGWLGHHCSRERVRKSGLWNQNHVEGGYDPAFLDRLEALTGAGTLAEQITKLLAEQPGLDDDEYRGSWASSRVGPSIKSAAAFSRVCSCGSAEAPERS